MFVAGMTTAAEPRRMPQAEALRDLRLIEPSDAPDQKAQRATRTRGEKPPEAPGSAFRGAQHAARPARATPIRMAQLPAGGQPDKRTEPPAQPSEDLFEVKPTPDTPETKPPGEMPDTQPPAETPETQPPAEAPTEQPPTVPPERFFEPAPPGETPPAKPRRAPPPRVRPEEMPQPTPAPPRPRGSTPRAAPAPQAEPLPRAEPYAGQGPLDEEGEWLDYDPYAEACSSCCYNDDGGGSFYDHYCPSTWPVLPALPPGTWVNVDYLMWWGRGQSLPPLVTIGGATGALDTAGVSTIFGNRRFDTDLRSGGRITVGTWLDAGRTVGIVGSFLDMQRGVTNFRANSEGDPLLARPYFNTITQANDSIILAQAGISRAAVEARTTANFLAADGYFRHAMLSGTRRRIDFTWGYRWLEVEDSIRINDREVITDGGGIIPLGTIITGRDEFRAANQFNGAQIGIHTDRIAGRVSWNTLSRISFGNMRQSVSIEGDSAVREPDANPVVTRGDLLAQPSNIGSYHRDVFAVVPEFSMNLNYQVTPRIRATLGYTIIYINRVAQAGAQIDTSVDPTQFGGGPPGNAPIFSFKQNPFWMQGINLGVSMRF